MKKAIFTLAILAMAFGDVALAQTKGALKNKLKSNATETVMKHYGLRDESTIVPQEANWVDAYNDHYRVTYTYDEYDYYLLEEFYARDEGDGWSVTYEYDFAGNVIEMLGEMATLTGEMQNDYMASYTYDGDELSEVVYQYWSNGNWMNETKEVYNYNGDVTTVLYWEWNGSNWSSDELYTYTHGNGTIELLIQYMQGGAWQNDEKQIMTLNFDERITEILVQDWENPSWVNEELTTYHYEGDVFPSKTVQDWNGSAWEDHLLFTYEYDEYGNAKHGECKENFYGQLMPADGDIEMVFGGGEKSYEYYGTRVDITYFDLMGLSENAEAMHLSVYPQPAQGEVNIEADGFAKAEIFNMAGQKVMESLSTTVNVATLPTGLYIIKVYDPEGNYATQRFVVK